MGSVKGSLHSPVSVEPTRKTSFAANWANLLVGLGSVEE